MPVRNAYPTSENPLKALFSLGQSPWLDFIRRDDLESGTFAAQQERFGIRGVTTNPTIFQNALSTSNAYDAAIEILARLGLSTDKICERLILTDVRRAADLLRPVYDASAGLDGFVSLEISPHLAHDTEHTIFEAQRLWRETGRPNLMIKVPGTLTGLPAICHLIAEGINVNVTLLFSVDRYEAVTEAYLDGLERAVTNRRSPWAIASVASFFVSRIDTAVDGRLSNVTGKNDPALAPAEKLKGQIAIDSAKCAYTVLIEKLNSSRFKRLEKNGARPQRLLWASTGTKNPSYSDIKYVERLIGPHTVNTMPLATLRAYADHGQPAVRITEGLGEARRRIAALASAHIDLPALTDELEKDAIRKFVDSFDALKHSISDKRQTTMPVPRTRTGS